MKKIKKLAAIGLAALLLVSTMSSLAVFAANDASVSLFTGGDIESATLNGDGSVKSFGGDWNSTFSGATLETEEVHSGTKAIKLTSDAGENTNFEASVYGGWQNSSTVDSYSEVRFWVKAEDLDTNIDSYVRIKLIKNSHDSKLAVDHIETWKIEEDSDWKMFSFPYDYSEPCYIQFRVYGKGIAYVDDVSVIDFGSIIPRTFKSNWINTVPTGITATDDNFHLDTTKSFEGIASLYLGKEEGGKAPVICHTFADKHKPVSGENYRFSFRFMPEKTGAEPLAYIAHTDNSGYVAEQYATFNPGYTLIKGDKQGDWQEYHAYFTMPEITRKKGNVVFCLRGETGNGYYDSFSLVRDYEEDVKAVNDAGVEVKTAAVGDEVSLQAHVISEIAEADGGENVMLLVAAYNGEGTLQCVDVACYAETVNKGTAIDAGIEIGGSTPKKNFVTAAKDVTFDYTVPENAAGCTLKAFCWNGGSLKPMGSAYKVTVAAK